MYHQPPERLPCRYEGCLKLGAIAGKSVEGYQLFAKFCAHHRKSAYQPEFKYRAYKKNHCEKCGFVAVHSAQLDVDHKDGNKKNTAVSNLQTLCANCHRLKTVLAGDHLNS